jgi:DegV family protein with EDD domain
MSKIRIVVDSAVDFPTQATIERHKITLVPQTITFGEERYTEVEEMDAEQFFRRLSHNVPHPTITAPTVERFVETYTKLSQQTDKIISIHSSRHISDAFENAKKAAQYLAGRVEIAVLDSQTTSMGLGLVTELAARTADTTTALDDAVRVIRGALGRVYSIFYVDTMDFIQKKGLIGEGQAILGAMLGIKPFLTIEDGHLQTMEKVRSRSQAIDKLVEFVIEFERLEKMIILQNSPFTTEAVRLLQDRLASEFGRRNFPTCLYGPTLASYLGTDATGVVVLERDYS